MTRQKRSDKEATFSGNIEIQPALGILQQLAIAESVRRALAEAKKPRGKEKDVPTDVQKEGCQCSKE